MTKAEEFEILLTRWEDAICEDIGRWRRSIKPVLIHNLKEARFCTHAVENTRIQIDGIIGGANISMLKVWSILYRRECPDYDGGDEILKIIHKLTEENYKWSLALDDIIFNFRRGAILIEDLETRIDEVTPEVYRNE